MNNPVVQNSSPMANSNNDHINYLGIYTNNNN